MINLNPWRKKEDIMTRQKMTSASIKTKFKIAMTLSFMAQALGAGIACADQSDQSDTIVVTGQVSEKTAFEMQFTFVQNSGAKLNNFPYQSYQVPFAKVKGVAPEDRATLTSAIQNWLKARKIGEKPMTFYISHSEVSGKYLYMVGEHQSNQAYFIRQEIQKCLEATKTPSGRRYCVYTNKRGIYVPAIVVGELAGARPSNITHLINNRRIMQDGLIYNDPVFTVQIDSISVQ